MKIHLFGNGKMGKMIAHLAPQLGHTLTPLSDAEVCLDFSHPEGVFSHLKSAEKAGKPLIVGTTGWEEKREEVKAFVAAHQMGVLAAPNFSIGIYVLKKLVETAAKALSPFEEYEVGALEVHHRKKIDAPSGTALALSTLLNTHFKREEKCHFVSCRVGAVPGTHTLLFDSPSDTLTLTHTARGRKGFARGALLAAAWIRGKKGFFSFEDCIEDVT